MPGIEDRLLHCIDENLRHQDEVIGKYGKKLDAMFAYSRAGDISEDLADAMNYAEKSARLKQRDFAGYRILHSCENVGRFEGKHGIKSFLFEILLSDEKWGVFAKKMRRPMWNSSIFYPACYFSGYHSLHLCPHFFGIAVGGGGGNYMHEALHCARAVYSGNFTSLDTFFLNTHYAEGALAAKAEIGLVDELLSYMSEGGSRSYIRQSLEGLYFNAKVELLTGIFPTLSAGNRIKRKRKIRKLLSSAMENIPLAVKAAFEMQGRLPSSMLTPLLFALGPTTAELKAGKYYSPFSEIILWAKMLGNGGLRQKTIKEALQKKGYCIPPKTISAG